MESLRVASINCKGQTKLNPSKQLLLDDLLRIKKLDVIFLQEVFIPTDAFSICPYIISNFNVFTNNSNNEYGTATLIRNSLEIIDVKADTSGRILICDTNSFSLANKRKIIRCDT